MLGSVLAVGTQLQSLSGMWGSQALGQTLRDRVCEAGRTDCGLVAPLLTEAVAARETRWLLGIATWTCKVRDETRLHSTLGRGERLSVGVGHGGVQMACLTSLPFPAH